MSWILHINFLEVSFRSGFEYNVKQLHGIEGFPAAANNRMKMENCDENDEMMKKLQNFAIVANGVKSEYDLYKR